jgi:hypothetical protein
MLQFLGCTASDSAGLSGTMVDTKTRTFGASNDAKINEVAGS